MKIYKETLPLFRVVREKQLSIKRAKITTSNDAANYLREVYKENADDLGVVECFYLLLLNRANNTIGVAKISQGGITETTVDIKIIVKTIIDHLAPAVILCHNHPSENMEPSPSDLKLTEKIKQAVSLVDSIVLDHIILSPEDTKYYSLADNGNL